MKYSIQPLVRVPRLPLGIFQGYDTRSTCCAVRCDEEETHAH